MNVNPAAAPSVPVPWWQQAFKRLIGDWPLVGRTVPLDQETFRDLFRVHPAFSDFLPLAGYEVEEGVFRLDDGVSVGAAFRLHAADLEARSPERQAAFRAELDHVLRLLPMEDDEFPYVVQIYLENREPANLADALAAAADPTVRETPFSQAWWAETRDHFQLMCSPRGIFEDVRISHSGEQPKGWRAIVHRFDPHFLHLDTIFSMVSENRALACTDVLDDEFLAWLAKNGIKVISVTYKEAMHHMACNVLALGNDRIISPKHCKRANEMMRAEGFEVLDPNLDQFATGGGSIHCMTMPLRRDPL